eukprot:GFUD01007460.1.p1 GENE.GFUD01007460.1~~GFUD01007460.1.p1  ORF type:complete len:236 (-),score=60.90 GFUD01007460.1:57-764(-)
MAELEMDTQGGLEIPPLNYNSEFVNFANIIQQNAQYHQQVAQKYIKGAVKARQEPLSFNKLDEAIQTLYDASRVVDSVKSEVNQKQEKLVIVGKEYEDINKKVNLTSRSAQEFSEAADKKQAELKTLVSATSDKGDIVEEKRVKLSAELAKWKKILGLELVNSSHGGIIFVFTNIDRESPERKFSCEVGLENRTYMVANCLPMVPGLESMVEILNRTNDLSGFVVNLRKKFASVK